MQLQFTYTRAMGIHMRSKSQDYNMAVLGSGDNHMNHINHAFRELCNLIACIFSQEWKMWKTTAPQGVFRQPSIANLHPPTRTKHQVIWNTRGKRTTEDRILLPYHRWHTVYIFEEWLLRRKKSCIYFRNFKMKNESSHEWFSFSEREGGWGQKMGYLMQPPGSFATLARHLETSRVFFSSQILVYWTRALQSEQEKVNLFSFRLKSSGHHPYLLILTGPHPWTASCTQCLDVQLLSFELKLGIYF